MSRVHISKSKRCFIVKSSTSLFVIKTKILADVQICISAPLIKKLHFFVRCSGIWCKISYFKSLVLPILLFPALLLKLNSFFSSKPIRFQEGAKAYLGVCQTSIMQLFLRKKLLLTVNYFHKKLQQRYLTDFEITFRAVFYRTSNICRSLICFRLLFPQFNIPFLYPFKI